MTIWILNHYAVTPDMPGGTRHYDFGRELVNRGHNVTVFASSFHHNQHKEMKLAKNEKWKVEDVDGINFVWLKTFPYQRNNWRRVVNMLSYMFRSYLVGRKILKINPIISKPDVVIGSSVHLLAVLSAYWLARYYKTKFIMEIRDLWPQTLIDIGKLKENSFITKVLRILETYLYRRAKKIITLSPLSADYLSSKGISKDKTCLIPNGVRIELFSKTKPRINLPGVFKVMYLGALALGVSLDTLIDAARIVQDKFPEKIKFILVGTGIDKPRLMNRTKEMKLSNLEFCDPVPKSHVPLVLNEADVLVLLEKEIFYGSSNKLHDYMASAKPIIFSTFAKHNTVEEAQCGVSVAPQDSKALADAAVRLFNTSEEERRIMGNRGREYVKKYHDFQVLADRLEKCIIESKS